MDTKLIAALACGAALALGACSGGNPATPAAPDPATTDPDADGRTAAERAFDDALAEAQRDLAAARELVETAEGLAMAADTDGKRTAAKALAAPSGDFGRIGRAAILVDDAEAAQADDETKLRAAEGSTGWAGSSALVIGKELLRPAPAVDAVRRLRRNADGTDAATLLTAAKVPAVMYDADENQIVMAEGLGSSGDRLRMRGAPVVAAAPTPETPFDYRQFLLVGPYLAPHPFLDPHGGGNNGAESKLVAGLRITPSGLVVDIGGKGAPGIDLRLPGFFTTAWVQPDGSNGGYDLTLDFGRPSASPEGNAEHYWTAALMPSPEHLEEQGALFRDGERTVPVGAYAVRLSNHAGLDRNLEDPDDPAASAEDDVNHYLSYAAYGHMEFRHSLDNQTLRSQRTFPFHVGYDAFKDEAGKKTTDIAERIKGTFKGRTMASQIPVPVMGGRHPPAIHGRLLFEAAGQRGADRDDFRNRRRQQDQRQDHGPGVLGRERVLEELRRDHRRSGAPGNRHRRRGILRRRRRHRLLAGVRGGRLQGELLRTARQLGGGRHLVPSGRRQRRRQHRGPEPVNRGQLRRGAGPRRRHLGRGEARRRQLTPGPPARRLPAAAPSRRGSSCFQNRPVIGEIYAVWVQALSALHPRFG